MNSIFEDLDLNSIDSIIEQNITGNTVKPPVKEVSKEVSEEVEKENDYLPDDPIEQVIQENYKRAVSKKKDSEEEVKEVNKEVKVDSVDSDKDIKNSPLVPYAAVLKEYGVLPDIDEEKFSKASKEEQIQMLMDAEEGKINNKAEDILREYVGTMPDRLRLAFESWADGVDLDLAVSTADTIDKYKNIDVESLEKNTELSRSIIKRDLMNKGYSSEEADELANEPLEPSKQAKKALERVIKHEESKIEADKKKRLQLEQEQIRSAEEAKKNLKKQVDTIKEIIPGLTIPNKLREKIWSNMTVPVKDKNGNSVNRIVAARNEDPINFEVKLNYLFEITKGFTDFSNIVATSKTNAVKQLEQQLERSNFSGGTPHDFSERKDDIMKSIKSIFKED